MGQCELTRKLVKKKSILKADNEITSENDFKKGQTCGQKNTIYFIICVSTPTGPA